MLSMMKDSTQAPQLVQRAPPSVVEASARRAGTADESEEEHATEAHRKTARTLRNMAGLSGEAGEHDAHVVIVVDRGQKGLDLCALLVIQRDRVLGHPHELLLGQRP